MTRLMLTIPIHTQLAESMYTRAYVFFCWSLHTRNVCRPCSRFQTVAQRKQARGFLSLHLRSPPTGIFLVYRDAIVRFWCKFFTAQWCLLFYCYNSWFFKRSFVLLDLQSNQNKLSVFFLFHSPCMSCIERMWVGTLFARCNFFRAFSARDFLKNEFLVPFWQSTVYNRSLSKDEFFFIVIFILFCMCRPGKILIRSAFVISHFFLVLKFVVDINFCTDWIYRTLSMWFLSI